MKKVAVVVGHNSRNQGAQSIEPIGRSEFDFNSEVADIMLRKADSCDFELKVFYRNYKGSYTQEIKEVYGKVNEWDADYSMELHFNSGVFTVSGSEVLSSGSKGSLRFANLLQDEFVSLFGRTGKSDRGVKVRKKGSRGYLSLISGKAPAIITEPFFGSNRYDVELMAELGLEELANAYIRAIEGL